MLEKHEMAVIRPESIKSMTSIMSTVRFPVNLGGRYAGVRITCGLTAASAVSGKRNKEFERFFKGMKNISTET